MVLVKHRNRTRKYLWNPRLEQARESHPGWRALVLESMLGSLDHYCLGLLGVFLKGVFGLWFTCFGFVGFRRMRSYAFGFMVVRQRPFETLLNPRRTMHSHPSKIVFEPAQKPHEVLILAQKNPYEISFRAYKETS